MKVSVGKKRNRFYRDSISDPAMPVTEPGKLRSESCTSFCYQMQLSLEIEPGKLRSESSKSLLYQIQPSLDLAKQAAIRVIYKPSLSDPAEPGIEPGKLQSESSIEPGSE